MDHTEKGQQTTAGYILQQVSCKPTHYPIATISQVSCVLSFSHNEDIKMGNSDDKNLIRLEMKEQKSIIDSQAKSRTYLRIVRAQEGLQSVL